MDPRADPRLLVRSAALDGQQEELVFVSTDKNILHSKFVHSNNEPRSGNDGSGFFLHRDTDVMQFSTEQNISHDVT